MRTIATVALAAALLVAVAAAALATRQALLTEDFVNELNARQDMPWTASVDNGYRVRGATKEDIKRMLGVKPRVRKTLPARQFSGAELATAIPDSFDAAQQWPHCKTITNIRDQSACGSCWAVAAAEAMSDRYCTGGGPANLEISAATLLSCCWYCGNGCNGGEPSLAWDYWVSTGLYSDACQPYPFPKCEHHIPQNHYPPCPSQMYPTPSCNSGSCSAGASGNTTVYKGKSAYSLSGEEAFQRELLANGPFEVSFDVYSDFPAYKSGVYVQKSNEFLGGHAVRVVGWGTLNGVKYWKIANSWNSDWGLSGYFLIRRGTDECGIEDSGSAGLAQLP